MSEREMQWWERLSIFLIEVQLESEDPDVQREAKWLLRNLNLPEECCDAPTQGN